MRSLLTPKTIIRTAFQFCLHGSERMNTLMSLSSNPIAQGNCVIACENLGKPDRLTRGGFVFYR